MNIDRPNAPLQGENLTLSYDKKVVIRELNIVIPHGNCTFQFLHFCFNSQPTAIVFLRGAQKYKDLKAKL